MSKFGNEMLQRQPELPEIPLPYGAVFPDWTVVTSDNAQASLIDTLGVLRMTKKWVGISIPEVDLHKSILGFYAAKGRPPTSFELKRSCQLAASEVNDLLFELQKRDLLVLDPKDGTIEGAYPFTERNTEHRLQLGDIETHAMCAVDALGTGAMLSRDTIILSRCRHCECLIKVETENQGMSIRSVTPEKVIVWSGIQEIDGCAADTQCQVMAFFCSDSHLEMWKSAQEQLPLGHRLSLAEGLQAGAAIFMPFLATQTRTQEINKERI